MQTSCGFPRSFCSRLAASCWPDDRHKRARTTPNLPVNVFIPFEELNRLYGASIHAIDQK